MAGTLTGCGRVCDTMETWPPRSERSPRPKRARRRKWARSCTSGRQERCDPERASQGRNARELLASSRPRNRPSPSLFRRQESPHRRASGRRSGPSHPQRFQRKPSLRKSAWPRREQRAGSGSRTRESLQYTELSYAPLSQWCGGGFLLALERLGRAGLKPKPDAPVRFWGRAP